MNPAIMNEYSYLPYKYPKRDLYTVSQFKDKSLKGVSFDVVRLAIDLAYLPDEKARDLNFNQADLHEYIQHLKKERNF